MLAQRTRIRVFVEGATTNEWFDPTGFHPEELSNGVRDILSKKFVVHSVSVMPRSTVLIGYLGWPYRAELDLTTTVGYNKPDDAASIVANAFYQIGGAMPDACVDGYGICDIKPNVDPSMEPSGFGWKSFAVVALIAITATAVFVAKRG
jgi:hypothetical protein